MTDHALSCQEVFEFFTAERGAGGADGQISEGAQNAFVNLYHRLSRRCPASDCEQRADCLLHAEGGPKQFDSEDGKLRFLRMKVRTEGRRLHRRAGRDPLVNDGTRLVGDVDSDLRGAALDGDWAEELAAAAERDARLDEALAELAQRLAELDLSAVRGGPENVAIAAEAARRLIARTGSMPVPETDEERREVVRALLATLSPKLAEGAPASVRQRQKRLRDVIRALLVACGGEGLAELWVPVEAAKRRNG